MLPKLTMSLPKCLKWDVMKSHLGILSVLATPLRPKNYSKLLNYQLMFWLLTSTILMIEQSPTYLSHSHMAFQLQILRCRVLEVVHMLRVPQAMLQQRMFSICVNCWGQNTELILCRLWRRGSLFLKFQASKTYQVSQRQTQISCPNARVRFKRCLNLSLKLI